jgi:hypothetical protein
MTTNQPDEYRLYIYAESQFWDGECIVLRNFVPTPENIRDEVEEEAVRFVADPLAEDELQAAHEDVQWTLLRRSLGSPWSVECHGTIEFEGEYPDFGTIFSEVEWIDEPLSHYAETLPGGDHMAVLDHLAREEGGNRTDR